MVTKRSELSAEQLDQQEQEYKIWQAEMLNQAAEFIITACQEENLQLGEIIEIPIEEFASNFHIKMADKTCQTLMQLLDKRGWALSLELIVEKFDIEHITITRKQGKIIDRDKRFSEEIHRNIGIKLLKPHLLTAEP
jgi:hypothetical protein